MVLHGVVCGVAWLCMVFDCCWVALLAAQLDLATQDNNDNPSPVTPGRLVIASQTVGRGCGSQPPRSSQFQSRTLLLDSLKARNCDLFSCTDIALRGLPSLKDLILI